MNWQSTIHELNPAISAVLGGLTVGVVTLVMDWLREARSRQAKRREASTAVVDVLGKWVRSYYVGGPTNRDLWQLQVTYWRNILLMDKKLVKLLAPCLANAQGAPIPNELIAEARRILLGRRKRDLDPSKDLVTWDRLPQPGERES